MIKHDVFIQNQQSFYLMNYIEILINSSDLLFLLNAIKFIEIIAIFNLVLHADLNTYF